MKNRFLKRGKREDEDTYSEHVFQQYVLSSLTDQKVSLLKKSTDKANRRQPLFCGSGNGVCNKL
jgi:hypothetical protein